MRRFSKALAAAPVGGLSAAEPTSGAAGTQSPSIARQAVHGVLWTYVSFAGSKLLVFASTVILARLLVPAQFGQVGFALLVISYLDTVGDFGVSSALIYQRKRPEEAADVAFLISLASGLLWFVAAFMSAPLVAEFFHDPGVAPIVRTMAFVFLINALGNTHDGLLRRNLAFKKRLVPDFAMALLKGTCSVLLALAGWGVWSLVWGQLAGALASTLALWTVVKWRPGWRGSWRTARAMLGYGGKIVSVNVVAAIVYNADFVIVGRLLGSAALGLYGLAYRVPELIITMVIWVVGTVTFPLYSKLRDDPPALRRAYLVTLRYLSLVSLPAGVGLAILGAPFVLAFFGDRWAAANATLQALALAAALRALGSHAGDVYKATGRPGILLKLGLLRAAVLVPAMIWGASYGILGVALVQLGVTGASTFLNLYVAGRVLSLSAWALLSELRIAALGSVAMAVFLELLLPALASMPSGVVLACGVGAGACVYLITVSLLDGDIPRQAGSRVVAWLKGA